MAGNRVQVTLGFNADTTQAQQALQRLNTQLSQIQSMHIDNMGINQELTQAAQAAQTLQSALQAAMNTNTGQINMTQFSAALKTAGTNVSQIGNELRSIGPIGTQAFASLSKSMSLMNVPMKQANKTLTTMMTTLKNTAKWEMASSAIHGLESAFKNSVNYVTELNEALTDIRVVSNQSVEDMTKFAVQANAAAKALGNTTKEYAKAALTYYQQGDSSELAAKKAEITLKATNVAFKATASEMSEMLTSTWNGFQVGADELERYVDIMANLGSHTASSVEEIATALQKVAATANTVGVSMEQMSSMIATVSSTTRQNAATVGTALNTILSRFASLKLGETLEDGLDLTKYTKALKTVGVEVLDLNGELRDAGTIVEELGEKWKTFSNGQKAAVAQTVGSVRQYTNMMALFNNWDKYKENLGYAENSEGALSRMEDTYLTGIAAAKKKLQATKEGLWSDLLGEDDILNATQALTGFVEQVQNLVNTFGGLPGILTTLGGVLTTVFSNQIGNSLTNAITKVQTFGSSLMAIKGDNLFDTFKKRASSFLTQSTDQRIYDQMNQQFKTELGKDANIYSDNGGMTAQIEATQILLDKKRELSAIESTLSDSQKAAANAAMDRMQNQVSYVEKMNAGYQEQEQNIKKVNTTLAEQTTRLQNAKTASDFIQARKDDNAEANKWMEGNKQLINGYTTSSTGVKTYQNIFSEIDTSSVNSMLVHMENLEKVSGACATQLERIQMAKDKGQFGDSFEKSAVGVEVLNNSLDTLEVRFEQLGADGGIKIVQQLRNDLQALEGTSGTTFTNGIDNIISSLTKLQTGAQASSIVIQDFAAKMGIPAAELSKVAAAAGVSEQELAKVLTILNLLKKTAGDTSFGSSLTKGMQTFARGVGSAVTQFSTLSNLTANWDTSSLTSKISGIGMSLTNVMMNFGNWPAMIMSIMGGVLGIIMGNMQKAENELAERLKENRAKVEKFSVLTSDEKEQLEANQNLLNSYEELWAQKAAGEDVNDKLLENSAKLIEQFHLEGQAINMLKGDYEAVAEAARQAAITSAEEDLRIAIPRAKSEVLGLRGSATYTGSEKDLKTTTYNDHYENDNTDWFKKAYNAEQLGYGGVKKGANWGKDTMQYTTFDGGKWTKQMSWVMKESGLSDYMLNYADIDSDYYDPAFLISESDSAEYRQGIYDAMEKAVSLMNGLNLNGTTFGKKLNEIYKGWGQTFETAKTYETEAMAAIEKVIQAEMINRNSEDSTWEQYKEVQQSIHDRYAAYADFLGWDEDRVNQETSKYLQQKTNLAHHSWVDERLQEIMSEFDSQEDADAYMSYVEEYMSKHGVGNVTENILSYIKSHYKDKDFSVDNEDLSNIKSGEAFNLTNKFEEAKSKLKENMSASDLKDTFQNIIQWGENGIISFDQFCAMSYNDQMEYLNNQSKLYNTQMVQDASNALELLRQNNNEILKANEELEEKRSKLRAKYQGLKEGRDEGSLDLDAVKYASLFSNSNNAWNVNNYALNEDGTVTAKGQIVTGADKVKRFENPDEETDKDHHFYGNQTEREQAGNIAYAYNSAKKRLGDDFAYSTFEEWLADSENWDNTTAAEAMGWIGGNEQNKADSIAVLKEWKELSSAGTTQDASMAISDLELASWNELNSRIKETKDNYSNLSSIISSGPTSADDWKLLRNELKMTNEEIEALSDVELAQKIANITAVAPTMLTPEELADQLSIKDAQSGEITGYQYGGKSYQTLTEARAAWQLDNQDTIVASKDEQWLINQRRKQTNLAANQVVRTDAIKKDTEDVAKYTDQISKLQTAYQEFATTGTLKESTKSSLEKLGIKVDDLKTLDAFTTKMKAAQTALLDTRNSLNTTFWKNTGTWLKEEDYGTSWDEYAKANNLDPNDSSLKDIYEEWQTAFENYTTAMDDWSSTLFNLTITKSENLYSQYEQRVQKLSEKITKLKDVASTLKDAIETGELTEAQKASIVASGSSVNPEQFITSNKNQRRAMALQAQSEYIAAEGARYTAENQIYGTIHQHSGWRADRAREGMTKYGLQEAFTGKESVMKHFSNLIEEAPEAYGKISKIFDELSSKYGNFQGMNVGQIIGVIDDYIQNAVAENEAAFNQIKAAGIDAMTSIYENADDAAKAAAASQIEIWKNAFEQIAELMKGVAEGKDLASLIAGDPEKAMQAYQQLMPLYRKKLEEEEKKQAEAEGREVKEITDEMVLDAIDQGMRDGTAGRMLLESQLPDLGTFEDYKKTTGLDVFDTSISGAKEQYVGDKQAELYQEYVDAGKLSIDEHGMYGDFQSQEIEEEFNRRYDEVNKAAEKAFQNKVGEAFDALKVTEEQAKAKGYESVDDFRSKVLSGDKDAWKHAQSFLPLAKHSYNMQNESKLSTEEYDIEKAKLTATAEADKRTADALTAMYAANDKLAVSERIKGTQDLLPEQSARERAEALRTASGGLSDEAILGHLNEAVGLSGDKAYTNLEEFLTKYDPETLNKYLKQAANSAAESSENSEKALDTLIQSHNYATPEEKDTSSKAVGSAEQAAHATEYTHLNNVMDQGGWKNENEMRQDILEKAQAAGQTIATTQMDDPAELAYWGEAAQAYDAVTQAITDLGDEVSETTNAFTKLKDESSTTTEIQDSIATLRGILNGAFGDWTGFTNDFITQNAELMEQWANGDIAAFEQIQAQVVESQAKEMAAANGTADAFDKVSDSLKTLQAIGDDLDFGEDVWENAGEQANTYKAALVDLQRQLGLTDAQMQKLLKSAGVTSQWGEKAKKTAKDTVKEWGSLETANKAIAETGMKIVGNAQDGYKYAKATAEELAEQGLNAEQIEQAMKNSAAALQEQAQWSNQSAENQQKIAESVAQSFAEQNGITDEGVIQQMVEYVIANPEALTPTVDPLTGEVTYTYNFPEVSWQSLNVAASGGESASGTETVTTDAGSATATVSSEASVDTEAAMMVPTTGGGTGTGSNVAPDARARGGGGGGGRRNKQKKDDHDRTRYHQTDRQLKKQNDLLTKNDKLKSRKYGSGYLDSLKAENKELKNQINLNKEKIKEAQKYLEKDKKELEQNGATFDEDGNVDYDAYEKKWQDEYNRMVDQYNNGAIDDDAWTEFQKKYDNAMDAVERYEEAQDRIAEAQEAILEAQNQISANKLEMVTYELELKVELDQRQIDLLQTMLKLYENDLDKSSKLLTNYIEQMRLLQHQSNAAPEALANLMSQAGISSLDKIKQDKDGFIIPTVDGFDGDKMTVKDFAEGLKSIADQAQSSLDAIIEMRETMLSFYGDVIDKGEEKFSALANTMKHLNNMMSGYLELVDLYNTGGDVWDKKATIMEAQYDTQLQTIDMYEARMKLYQQQETELEAELQKDPTNEAAKRALEDLKDTKEQAEEEWLDAVKTAAQTAKDLYQNSVDEIMDQMNKLNGEDMDWLKTKADLWKKNNDLYVDEVTKIYEVDKLTRKIEDSIADTRSKSNQAELKALKEKIKLQADSNELSEYDIEMMNKEYELLLAKQDLENAKDAKNQVRLTRDENGNMIYQYTTDQDAVSEAEQKYNDVLYEMHKTSKEHLNDLYENLQETEEAYRAAVEQIWNDATLTAEEKQQRLDEVNEAYGKILDNLGSQIEITYGNLTDYDTRLSKKFAGELEGTAFNTDQYLNTTLVAMSKKADDFKQGMITCQTALVGALDSYSNRVDLLQEHTHTKWEDMTSDLGKFKTAATNTKNETDQLIETLKKSLEDAMNRIIKDFKNWNSEIEKTIKNLSSMIDKINAVLTALASLGDDRRDGGRREGDDGRRDGDDGRRDGGRRDGDDGRRDGGRRDGGSTPRDRDRRAATLLRTDISDAGNSGHKLTPIYTDGPHLSEARIEAHNSNRKVDTGGTWTCYCDKCGHYMGITSKTAAELGQDSSKTRTDSRVRVPGSVRAATGGLIDYTGPAWVDGTEPNPEYVLNADQTKMMFGILSSGVMDKLLNALIYAAQAMSMTSLNANNLANSYTSALSDASSSVQQTVYVNAEFPAATDKQEIVSALTEIYNKTSHYVNRQTTVGL